MRELKPLEWRDNKLICLDQTRLPDQEIYLEINSCQQVIDAIKRLAIRGAPAIGIATAYGIVLGSREIRAPSREDFLHQLEIIMKSLASSRPTARNLFWAIERMNRVAQIGNDIDHIRHLLFQEALKIHQAQLNIDLQISKYGATLISDGDVILTHCNTGVLATAGYGTALGIIKYAFSAGKKIQVIATETRPLLQGARLTAWELQDAGIPFFLITDSMAGYFMRKGMVNLIMVGADRIARNGDTANKIGTYTLAVLAKEHHLPFYIAAPTSTVDTSISSGDEITIEERAKEEVTQLKDINIAPAGIQVGNPAFDITPGRYISAIITEKGIFKKPFTRAIQKLGEDQS